MERLFLCWKLETRYGQEHQMACWCLMGRYSFFYIVINCVTYYNTDSRHNTTSAYSTPDSFPFKEGPLGTCWCWVCLDGFWIANSRFLNESKHCVATLFISSEHIFRWDQKLHAPSQTSTRSPAWLLCNIQKWFGLLIPLDLFQFGMLR